MKKLLKYIMVLVAITAMASCKKEGAVSVDVNDLNPDDPVLKTELDNWLKTTFLDPYNMAVVYRYNRYYHDNEKNIAPAQLEMVKPTMETVLNGYINPYYKIAGRDFIKRYIPKEWVLYGSYSYNTDGVVIAGTASAGRRITLYGLNNYEPTPSYVSGHLGVIHHEFTHILNQLVAIPTDFESISKEDYKATWASTPTDTSHKYGFVSSYASGSYPEDYAETVRALLVSGQSWYDNWANTASAVGKARLKAKESNVVNYFNSGLGINFRNLQKEVQTYITDVLGDQTKTFGYWLKRGLYKTLTVNLEDGMYNTYGSSAGFASAYNYLKAAIKAWSPNQYHLDYVQFRFESATTVTVRIAFTAAAGGTQFVGDYTFAYAVGADNKTTTFTKVAQAGTTGSYANAAIFAADFEASIQQYLTTQSFNAGWTPTSLPADLYTRVAGFTSTTDAQQYFYGPLTQ